MPKDAPPHSDVSAPRPAEALELPDHIVLVAKHIGINSGGEAIKAHQFARLLVENGVKVTVVTHERTVKGLGADQTGQTFHVVEDDGLQRFFWRVKPLRGLLDIHFHLMARRLIRRHVARDPKTTLHYIGPVSPVMPRFFPKGYDIVLGPLTGNIFYPPAFRERMSPEFRNGERFHAVAQKILGRIFPEKRNRARVVLVSGYERTRASLRMARVREEQMVDVVDSGVADRIRNRPRIEHRGPNPRFVCSGRMVDHKGVDLAIRAVARADPKVTLDVFGDGEKRAEWEALSRELGLEGRVTFKGWVASHDDLLDAFENYRGYLFPTLAEANGIVMQEAMMVGMPVITLNWGGPSMLADKDSAVYVEPLSQDHVLDGLAAAMTRLAEDPDHAEAISKRARRIAEARFSWEAVADSWLGACFPPKSEKGASGRA
ncbi:glycosyltransferase family 4 protein [Palleronia sp. LCG004]|uniref:glycosyltransferase family 4 protein n=1 Tax=Palleronia sp. LCG004 TaxID=3079304 RepID=UPI002943C6D3|nr:glycosyltransferase family 4 protein [Palleronia sp. LCG004]WOI58395.1 glycosyltransferase family 4 protein [Palleronia sp. LCG004]